MKKLEDMLYCEIVKRKISQSDLCRGLCSTSAFSRYLRGERKIDRLLLNVLMQRLGKSPDKFTTVLSEDEYYYFAWRQRVCHAQVTGNWEKMDHLLNQKNLKVWNCNVAIQEQFSLLMEGVVQEKLFKNRNASLKLVERAIAKTIPEFFDGDWSDILLSVQEISAILLWQSLQENKNKSMEVLCFLLEYIVINYKDEQQLEKIYPQIASPYLSLLFENGQYFECLSVSEKALRMMISSGYSPDLEKILESNVESAEKLGLTEKVTKRKVQLVAWKEMMGEINPFKQGEDATIYMLDAWQEIELLDELISLGRIENGLTQEQLSEEICTPESLSRIENGKRPPNRKNYNELMKKLSLREQFYYSKIETDDFAVLEIKWKLEKMVMNKEWVQAGDILSELKHKMDLSIKINKQYVEEKEYVIDNCMGRILLEERLPRLFKILEYTMDEIPKNAGVSVWENVFERHPFSAEEISVLIHVADTLLAMKETTKAIDLLERIMMYYRKSRVLLEFHYRTVLLVMARLSTWYSKIDEYQKALSYSNEGIQVLIACGSRKMLGLFVNNRANALEHLGQKEECLKDYRLAFYCAELLEQGSAKVSKKSYERLIGESVVWY